MLSSYVEEYICEKKLKSDFHVFGWFPGLQILEVFLENLLVWKSFSDKNTSLKPLLFYFLTVFFIIWKNQESCES